MAINRNTIRDAESIENIRWRGGADVELESLVPGIETLCAENGINVAISIDEVDSGRIFDRSTTPCIVIKNADHLTDYNYYLFTMQKQGIYSFIKFYIGGTSKNAKRINQGNRKHETIAGQVFGAIMKATVSNDARDSEQMYYSILEDVLREFFT